jgi:CheY-like chemotaxis protein
LPTILVADDNSNIQKMVTLAFKGEGIDVVAVGNGEAAVKKSIEINPDLVLADIFMPVRSGYEVCEFLKQDPRFSHIPVVLLAGAFDPFDEREAQRVGADGVLKKPFVPPDPLVTLVKGLLAKNAEKLVAVAMPVHTAAISAQSASQNSAPVESASSAPAFAPPTPAPFPTPTSDPSVKDDEYPDDDIDVATTAPPMRDFLIPSTPNEPAHAGGADAFGSMLDTSPLGTVMLPMRKLGEPVVDDGNEEDREIQPASAHSAFEGFSPWRASASSAGVVEEEETPAQAIEEPNELPPPSKELMGRVWEIDPNSDKSPEETIIEPHDDISPLTHSSQHVTTVRSDSSAAAETSEVIPSAEVSETEPSEASRVSDWRSAFAQAKEESAQIVESSAPSMSPWSMPAAPAEAFQSEQIEEVAAAETAGSGSEIGFVSESASIAEIPDVAEVEASAETFTESVAEAAPIFENTSADALSSSDEHKSGTVDSSVTEAGPAIEPASYPAENFEAESVAPESINATPSMEVVEPAVAGEHTHHDYAGDATDQLHDDQDENLEHHAETSDANASVAEESTAVSDSAKTETNDWIAALPEHLSPADTVTIARSVVDQLAPSAVESMASSFPVPTAAPSDPKIVEEIVARVVERMQPQILEMITREVLRPVVEALVRRQLEQKLPE